MSGPYTGQCTCGQISLHIEAEPNAVRQCWCRQCQQAAAGGPTNNAIFPADAVQVAGELAEYSYTVPASGNELTRLFCPRCGTPVMARSSARPHLRIVRLGILDPGHGLHPGMAIWASEKPEWAVIDPALEQLEHGSHAPPKIQA